MSVEYITPGQAAELLRVNERTVRRWIREGKLSARRFGRLLRIPKSDLEAQIPPSWASESAFKEDWDNPLDADYDKWQEAYHVREG
jgi:excisionase family DNA binding protein